MSRRPPTDTFDSVYAQPAPQPQFQGGFASPYAPQPAPQRPVYTASHPNFNTYSSPFQAPPAAPTGMSALVDFKEGIQIVDDDMKPEQEQRPSKEFLHRNGTTSSRGKGSMQPPDESIEEEMEPESATQEDIRSMVEENLRRNCKIRNAAKLTDSLRSKPEPLRRSFDSDRYFARSLPRSSTSERAPWHAPSVSSRLGAGMDNHNAASVDMTTKTIREAQSNIRRLQEQIQKRSNSKTPAMNADLPAADLAGSTRASRLLTGSLDSMIRA